MWTVQHAHTRHVHSTHTLPYKQHACTHVQVYRCVFSTRTRTYTYHCVNREFQAKDGLT